MKNLDGHSETARNGHRKTTGTSERPKAEPYSSKKSILSNDSILNGLKVEETTSDPGLDSGNVLHKIFIQSLPNEFRFVLWNMF